jgi:hypothetical protein
VSSIKPAIAGPYPSIRRSFVADNDYPAYFGIAIPAGGRGPHRCAIHFPAAEKFASAQPDRGLNSSESGMRIRIVQEFTSPIF